MRPITSQPKPAHLGPKYGAQFEDASVAAAYRARPPYPPEFFATLRELLAPGPRTVLELGSGTGDVTLGLLSAADRIDAVEPSAAMLAVARRRPGAGNARIRWTHASAEAAHFEGPYALAVAAESLHWTEWDVVLPKIAASLRPGAVLALAERGFAGPAPWDAEVHPLVAKYSTNRDFRPCDLVEELTSRGLFRETGRRTTSPLPFTQSIDDYVESFHSRNGVSRDRMDPHPAAEFDRLLRSVVERHLPGGQVRLQTVVHVVWGVPALRELRSPPARRAP